MVLRGGYARWNSCDAATIWNIWVMRCSADSLTLSALTSKSPSLAEKVSKTSRVSSETATTPIASRHASTSLADEISPSLSEATR